MRSFLFTLVLLVVVASQAQENKPLQIKWKPPEMTDSKVEGRRGVVLSGVTLPGAKISFPTRNLVVMRPGQDVELMSKSSALRAITETQTNSAGEFALILDLPVATVQVALLVSLGAESKTYQLQFEVQNAKVKLEGENAPAPVTKLAAVGPAQSRVPRKKFRSFIGVGGGLALSTLKTTIPSASTDVSASAATGTSFSFIWRRRLTKTWALAFDTSQVSGVTGSDGSIGVNGGVFSHVAVALKGEYGFSQTDDADLGNRIAFVFGPEFVLLPYISQTSTSAIEITNNSILFSSLGIRDDFETLHWLGHASVAELFPILRGAPKMSGFLSFSADIGIARRLGSHWSLGLDFKARKYALDYTLTDKTGQYTAAARSDNLQYGSELALGYLF